MGEHVAGSLALEAAGRLRALTDPDPACSDCPIGGRDGDGPTCPRALACDQECAEHRAAYAAERGPVPPDPTPEEVEQVLGEVRAAVTDRQAEQVRDLLAGIFEHVSAALGRPRGRDESPSERAARNFLAVKR